MNEVNRNLCFAIFGFLIGFICGMPWGIIIGIGR